MSLPSNFRLPPPPGTALSAVTPGNQPHTRWDPIYIHTAKCDVCHKHNTSTIQRCVRCNRQLCRDCIPHASLDGIHFVQVDELDWSDRARKIRAKRSKGRKRAATSTTSQAPSKLRTSRRIKKATVSRTTRHAPSDEGLLVELCQTVSELGTDAITERQSPNLSQTTDGGNFGTELTRPLERAESSRWTFSQTPETTPPSNEQYRRTTIRFRKPFNGSSSTFLPPSSTPTVTAKKSPGPTRIEIKAKPAFGGEVEGPRVRHAASLEPHSPPGRTSTPSADDTEDDLEHRDETFDEIIGRLRREKDATRLNEEEQLMEDRFQFEMNSAWESNPEVCALRREGREGEAIELMEAAGILIRAQRGL